MTIIRPCACITPHRRVAPVFVGPAFVGDADGARRRAFMRAMGIEREYARKLRSLAQHVARMVRDFPVDSLAGAEWLRTALRRYADSLTPWAEAVARTTVTEVAARDERQWFRIAEQMGRALREEIANAPTGAIVRRLQAEQVTLIKSIPFEAGERVHRLAMKGIEEGQRADALLPEIMRTGEVTLARAKLIARTETGRISTNLTQARAEGINSPGYIWRTVGDTDVRPSHRAMNGKTVKWNEPPTLDGLVGHAGALPNCRCYCEPIIPDHLLS